MKKYFKLIILVFIILSISACSSKPTHLKLIMKSTSELNPNENSVPSPLMVHFYELESAEKFMKFDYWTLLANHGKNLSSDLISQTKYIITPEQQHTYKIAFDKKAKFLGVVGKFRDIKDELAWKYVINLEKDIYNYHEIIIDKYDIKRVK